MFPSHDLVLFASSINKLKFLFQRYCLLIEEANKRGYNINYTIEGLYNKYSHLIVEENQINYTPSGRDIKISQERINLRLLDIMFKGGL